MPISRIEYNYPVDGWLPSREGKDPVNELGIRLVGTPKGTVTLLYADIPGQSWTPARLEAARQYVQDLMDTRILRSTLDPLHPYIVNGDPALEWLFWEGEDVVVRTVIIGEITWIGYPSFSLSRPNTREWRENNPWP